MYKKFTFITFILSVIVITSLQFAKPILPAEQVKNYYKTSAQKYIIDLNNLKESIEDGKEKDIQNVYLKVRESYKKIEIFVEYYFPQFATKLNGAPIPYFEEDEGYSGQIEPTGMQVIEALVFPTYHYKKNATALKLAIDELFNQANQLLQTNESFAFTDEYITDAIIEELYRITALGLVGFDSQVAYNGLPECNTALESIKDILFFYKENLTASTKLSFNSVQELISNAQNYLTKNKNFDTFNRMEFIQQYLNPLTKIVTTFKLANNFSANKSARFYSTVKKDNTLFAPNNFDVYKYLDDNKTSAARIELGRKLFFDKQLSIDNKRSCASCHQPNKAFTDGLQTSVALDGHSTLPRNAPTLWNVALQRNLFLDNRSRSLEEQVMQVLNNSKEMNGSAQNAAEKIIVQKEYTTIYKSAYSNATINEAANNICNAIACFERTLIALNSKFDKHINGQKILSANEINGFNIFMGKAKCATCHFMPLFNGSKPPRYYSSESEVIGVPKNNVKQNAVLDADEGRFTASALPLHKYAFKTPTLRNVALTAPYMHNGFFKTLEQVVDFYNKGGGKGLHIAPTNQTLPFDKLNLTQKEKNNLVLFMKALTDTAIAD
jgi:cytochrome c peroxidase